ncbi:unnamed protein product [Scytosiphon promiscuus]
MAADDAATPIEMLPPVGLDVAAAVVDVGGGSGVGCAPGPAGKVAGRAAAEGAEIRKPATPHTPQVSSKHWRKIRSAVVALAAFRSRRVKAADFERIRMCGEGGSGLVYLVRLKNTTMFFALKVRIVQHVFPRFLARISVFGQLSRGIPQMLAASCES